MSIKSEKEIRELAIDFSSHPNSPVAQKASFIVADVMLPYLIRKVEQRCRERAVRAFQASCDNYDNGNCELWYGVESERKCPGEMGCASIDNFLKNYDNEQ